MTATLVAPVKGLVFRHARRTEYGGGGSDAPAVCTITSVSKTTVFYSTRLWRDTRFKMKIESWERLCLEVVSEPAPVVQAAEPTLTAAQYAMLMGEAHTAGMRAGEAIRTSIMLVNEHANQMDDASPIVRQDVVMDGPCGFAYLKTKGNTPFGRYVKSIGWRKDSYAGGYFTSVGAFNQSYERKAAYAAAYTEVLRQAGLTAYYETRMD